MIVNRSAPPGTIVPTLIYDDVAKAIDWLCDVFGFTERLRAGSPEKGRPCSACDRPGRRDAG